MPPVPRTVQPKSKLPKHRKGPITPRYLPNNPPVPLNVDLPIPEFEKLPYKVKKCCFCFRLKTAKMLMGLVFYALGSCSFVLGLFLVTDTSYPTRSDVLNFFVFYGQTVFLIFTSICLILEYCNGQRKGGCLLIIMCVQLLDILFFAIFLAILIYLMFTAPHVCVYGLCAVNVLTIALLIYNEVCVYSMYCSTQNRLRNKANRCLEEVIIESNEEKLDKKRSKLLRDIASFVL